MDAKTLVETWIDEWPLFDEIYEEEKQALIAAIDAVIAEAVRQEKEACCRAIRAACGACGGQGGTVPFRGYVTREMAIDAGEPMMEGEPMYDQPVECEYCGRPIAAIRAMTP